MVVPENISEAASRGDTAAIQGWFSSGTRDPDDGDQFGFSLLHLAALHGRCDTMRFLLDHGASVDATDDFGATALSETAFSGELDAAVLLLDRGAQIDLANNNGLTQLMWAAGRGHCDMIRLLLSRGANLAARTNDGQDAEARARDYRKDEAAALLADVRLAGGTWDAYVRYPRKRLLALRVLCERGRASTDDDLLARVFGPNVRVPQGIDPAIFVQMSADEHDMAIRASLRTYPTQPKIPRGVPRTQLPKEVFWLILKFRRFDCDS